MSDILVEILKEARELRQEFAEPRIRQWFVNSCS